MFNDSKDEKRDMKAGISAIAIGIIMMCVPIMAFNYAIPFWWLSILYPSAIILAGCTKTFFYFYDYEEK